MYFDRRRRPGSVQTPDFDPVRRADRSARRA